ncbi:MAG: YigZ family protein [Bacteroidia bacterium]|jgi:uncharacterized YigZ family protein
MMFTDLFHTLKAPAQGEFKDRGSKFLAFAFPVHSETEVKEELQRLKKEHFDAVHHCFAYVLGAGKEIQKFSDDREPSGTAGRPLLRAILSRNLTNSAVIVVRYFGGKLLGVPGLIAAYEGAALDALNHAAVDEQFVMEQYVLQCAFGNEHEAFRLLKQFEAQILNQELNEQFSIVFGIRRSKADACLLALRKNHRLSVSHHATNS